MKIKNIIITLALSLLTTNIALADQQQPECITNIDSHLKYNSLNLSNCFLGDEDMPAVVAFAKQHAKEIHQIFLGGNFIHSKGAELLAGLTGLKPYIGDTNTGNVGLDLTHNLIGDKGAIALASSSFEAFYLTENQISDAGAKALAADGKLVFLELAYNRITDQGAIALAGSPSLQYLYLEHNQIGDEGAIAIAKNTNLTQIWLSENHIGDAGALAFIPRLANQNYSLHLQNNNIGEDAVNKLLPYFGNDTDFLKGNPGLKGVGKTAGK